MNAVFKFFILGFIPTLWSFPFDENKIQNDRENFIGKGTNEIATALLQGFVAKEENMVYSPFGYSAILAVFSEGASGASRDEIANALHFPKDVDEVRKGYQRILERFVEKKSSNFPEFKNWFYIYKNYTMNEELQDILRKYYHTEVKFVERPEEFIKETEKTSITDKIIANKNAATESSMAENNMEDNGYLEANENLIKTGADVVQNEKKPDGENMESIIESVKVEKDKLVETNEQKEKKMEKKEEENKLTEKKEEKDKLMEKKEEKYKLMVKQEDKDKLIEIQEEKKKLVEMNENKGKVMEMNKENEKMMEKKEEKNKLIEMEDKSESQIKVKSEKMEGKISGRTEESSSKEKTENEKFKNDESNSKENKSDDEQKLKLETNLEEENMNEKMSESDEKNTEKTKSDEEQKKDEKNDENVENLNKPTSTTTTTTTTTTSSEPQKEEMEPIKTSSEMGVMPLEHFSGMTDSSIKIKGNETKPQMIIFNGLYYKGEWEVPFEKKPADDSRVFYKSENEKIFVSTIHSQGLFYSGEITNLDCKAIELPYKGGRYSLLILVPLARDGLTKLISDLSGYPLQSIYDQLQEKLVDVSLPCFEINTISKPISSLRKLGVQNVTSIFNPETADLSKISHPSSGLYVEELVQMVTFKVEADNSKANFLTASIASSRSSVQNFQVNQPFLFYLRDTIEDLTIVNGKVIDPTPKPSFYFS